MAYTVKQVAAMSGVSVRTLHFYDEMGLLKPAFLGTNGYRRYEEPQLLRLQQILFYRELDFELREIKKILGRANFEIIAALRSHRRLLQRNAARSKRLVETIDKTIKHLKGTKKMKSDEMFSGFCVAPGKDRFGKSVQLGGDPYDCKLSAQDTGSAMCVFEINGHSGGPKHLHNDLDEWIYVMDGEFEFHIGEERFRLGPGGSVFIPRKVAHVWAGVTEGKGRLINTYQPAGQMEEFFSELSRLKDVPTVEQVLQNSYTQGQKDTFRHLFRTYGMELLGPPLIP